MAETIGSLIDKITIVDLKIYHMQEQVDRIDVNEGHKSNSQLKVAILFEQKKDLTEELSVLSEQIVRGDKKLKVYRQFKMYNDPIYRANKK